MATEILVNIGSGNGLLPNGTKPLPEPISVAYRYRKSISIIELFVSIYIDIYRVLGN